MGCVLHVWGMEYLCVDVNNVLNACVHVHVHVCTCEQCSECMCTCVHVHVCRCEQCIEYMCSVMFGIH